jgi:hypothetical protein
MTEISKTLLVYIPCHSDLDLAIFQAQKIQNEFKDNREHINSFISKIEIVISINYFQPSESQLLLASSVSDLIINHSKLFLADANIAHGFLVAFERNADFLWMLSTNDELLDQGLSKMLNALSNDIDLLVTSLPEINDASLLTNVINPPMKGYSFGLISGVVYNCQSVSNSFNVANFFVWTGWSQLSVIQNAINQKNGLKIRTINTFEIYKQRQTPVEKLSHKYGHSFYGYLILGFVFAKTKKDKKRFIRTYILSNTFNILLYKRDTFQTNNVIDPDNYLAWNQDIAEAIIKHTSLLYYCYYYLISKLPFWFFTKIHNRKRRII